MNNLYQLFFYVSETYLEQVKNAVFEAGAGRVGNYLHCAWQTKGEGQFCPLSGSNPYIGKINHLEKDD